MNWNISFSNYDNALNEYYNKNEPEFMGLREKLRQVLQAEDELTEIVQLVGKDSLSEDQKAVLKVSIFINLFCNVKSMQCAEPIAVIERTVDTCIHGWSLVRSLRFTTIYFCICILLADLTLSVFA